MTEPIPSFKLWLFELKRADAFFVSVLWCPIGLEIDSLSIAFPPSPPETGDLVTYDEPEPPSPNLSEMWSLEDLESFADPIDYGPL